MSLLAIDLNFADGIEDAWTNVAEFVPKLVAALAILIIGWFIAKIVASIANRILRKIRFDDWVDRSGLGAPLERAGYADSGRLLAKIVYWGIMLIVLQLAIGVFGDSPVQEALDGILAFLPKLFVALIIVVITGAIASRVREFVAAALNTQSYGNAVATGSFIAIWLIGGFAALDQIEVAADIVQTLWTVIVGSLGLILVIKFGVGGIAAARDRFWPRVYDRFEAETRGPG